MIYTCVRCVTQVSDDLRVCESERIIVCIVC